MTIKAAIRMIGQHKDKLTRQQLKTLRGQALSGNTDVAVKGLYRIIKEISSFVEISESTLYPILRRLEAAEFLTVRTAEHNGSRSTDEAVDTVDRHQIRTDCKCRTARKRANQHQRQNLRRDADRTHHGR